MKLEKYISRKISADTELLSPDYCTDCGKEAPIGFRDETFCKPCAINHMTLLEADLKGYEQRLLAFLNLNLDQKALP